MAISVPFLACGRNFVLHCVSGIVVGTDQRSDTRVTGGGRMIVVDGYGGGRTDISSTVTISRDIWLQDESEQEIHLRTNQDIPVRQGQTMSFIYLRGEHLYKQRPFEVLLTIYNTSVNQSWLMSEPVSVLKPRPFNPILAWAAGLGLLAFHLWVLGLIVLAILFARHRYYSIPEQMTLGRFAADARAEIMAQHQTLLNELHMTHAATLRTDQRTGHGLVQ